jgi:hypothetical protein
MQASARIPCLRTGGCAVIQFSTLEELPKKIPQAQAGVFSLVDLARENWSYIFEDLQLFCERLEELDIEVIILTDG